jgi:ABC-type dipeptide/oligopeptide/nickel transport system permease component
MKSHIGKRVLWALVVIVLSSFVLFTLMELPPPAAHGLMYFASCINFGCSIHTWADPADYRDCARAYHIDRGLFHRFRLFWAHGRYRWIVAPDIWESPPLWWR